MSDLARGHSARLGDLVRGMRVMPGTDRVALCVGVAAYASSPLRNAANDARDMAAALRELDFKVTTLLDPGLEALLDGVEAFAEALHPGGIAFFFFAGHGCQARPAARRAGGARLRHRRFCCCLAPAVQPPSSAAA